MQEREQQFKYEEDADVLAAAKRLEELRTGALDGELELPRASRLMARMYIEVQQSLEATLAIKTRGIGGRLKNWVRAIPKDLAAVIAIRECISMLSSPKGANIQALASSIGRLWELEIKIAEAKAVNPMYMQKVAEQIKDRCTTDKEHIRKVYNFAYDQVMKGALNTSLNQAECIQLGRFGVQACMDAGMVYSTRNSMDCNTVVQFHLTPEVYEFLTDYTESDVRAIMDKAQSAMTCAPDPWSDLSNGGYLTPRRKLHSPLMSLQHVRRGERDRLRELFTAENMPLVFAAGNYLQSVAFTLHKPTAEAQLRLWRAGGGVMGVPTKTAPTKPECPLPSTWVKDEGTDEEREQFSRWKRRAVAFYDELSSWRGHVRELSGHLKVLALHEGRPIWFPVYLDTRGRWYYRGVPNPQGSDLAKSALHFADKKPLGQRGVFWLKVHIANSYGFDKERFVDRAAWTDKHWPGIERALDEPENYPDVFGDDAPWCMFSAAWELREAYRSGNPAEYSSGIVVHMDATCSGLQHFSALLRDPVGAQCVNLTDDLKCGPKQDIYSKVSTTALRSMQNDLEGSDVDRVQMATWWLQQGIPRAMSKKPVMTYVYGATLRGTTGFVRDYVETELKLKWPEPDKSYRYAQYAATKLFEGIAGTVPSAEYAMNWLRGIAKAQPRGKRMEWRTPTGFAVQHDYQDYNEKKVFISSCGMEAVMVRLPTEDTKPIQMQNAIAPNFVHALDASHLTFTALRMQEAGLSMVGIHDSFGTHACDVDEMHGCIRSAFVQLYQGRNILGEFLWDVQAIGEAPMRGSLDVACVLESEFFFS